MDEGSARGDVVGGGSAIEEAPTGVPVALARHLPDPGLRRGPSRTLRECPGSVGVRPEFHGARGGHCDGLFTIMSHRRFRMSFGKRT